MTLRILLLGAFLIALAGAPAAAKPQSSSSSHHSSSVSKKKKTTAPASKSRGRKAASRKKQLSPAARAALARRARRAHRAFVASSELRPMAQQLLENRTPAAYAGVEQYARKHAAGDAGALAYLVLGYAHFLDHDFTQAIPDLKRAGTHAGELSDYTDYFLATCYASTGASDQALAILRNFAAQHADSLFVRDAAVLQANTLLARGDARPAITLLSAYRTPYRPEVELVLGRAYLRAGDTGKGIDVLRRIYYTAPASPQADAANTELQANASAEVPPPTFAERVKRAALLVDARRYPDAVKEYRALLGGSEPSTLNELQLNLGVALYRSGSKSSARETLEQVPDQPDDIGARRNYYLMEVARSDGDEERVNKLLDRMRQSTPAAPALQDALLSAGNMYLLKKDYDRAAKLYHEVFERFPNGKTASYAHWKATWLTLRLDRKDEARQMLDEHLRLYPASAEAVPALYWRGRIAEEDKDWSRARGYYRKLSERFRFYYYADLARERLKELKLDDIQDDPVLAHIPDPAQPAPLSTDPPADSVRLQRSLLLRNGGLFDYAVKELQAANEDGDAPWASREIARVYQDEGQYYRALQTLKRAVPSYFSLELASLPRPYWETLFPRPWWDDVKRYSADHQLDPFIVASLVRQESEFNPSAISHANAFGLMQILPSVGSKLAKDEKIRRFSSDQLLVPNTNLRLGTRYFRELLDHFGGHVEYALAAYNAGTDRVEDWLNSGHYRDTAEFVESIPFTETREYVQAIMRNATLYRRLYGNP